MSRACQIRSSKRETALAAQQLLRGRRGPGFARCAVSARLFPPEHMADALAGLLLGPGRRPGAFVADLVAGASLRQLPRKLSRSAVWGRMVTQRSSSAKSVGSTDQPIVFVVDDDASMRQALTRLLQSVQLRVEVFRSPQEFLQSERPNVPSCLVLDVRLPGLSGLDFQAELLKADVRMPIVFITGHGDIPMSVRAMKAGAVDFLAKPFRDQDLLDAVTTAIQRDQKRRELENAVADLRTHFSALTPREREIMALVASGLMSKQIAAQIGLSEITVKVHRSHVMKKMGARSVADLVRMAEALGVKPATPQR